MSSDPALLAQLSKCFEKKSALMKDYDSTAGEFSRTKYDSYRIKMEAVQYQITEVNNDIKILGEILKGPQIKLDCGACNNICHKS